MIKSYGKGSQLSEATKAAEAMLWIQLYTSGDGEKFKFKDFREFSSRAYKQDDIDRAVQLVFRWALSSVRKERQYRNVCDQFYVVISFPTKQLVKPLRDRALIKEFVQFTLEKRYSLVKEELKWQYRWKRMGVRLPDYRDDLVAAGEMLDKFDESDLFVQHAKSFVFKKKTALEGMYIRLYGTRHEGRFKALRKKLVREGRSFNEVVAMGKAVTSKDFKSAREKLKNLASKDIEEAFFLLGLLLDRGLDGEINKEEALQWLKLASIAGQSEAHLELARYYAQGTVVPRNFRESMRILKLAFKDMPGPSQREAAKLLLEGGPGLKKDIEKGIILYTRSANVPDGESAYDLGIIYLEGTHVGVDLQKAEEWLVEAEELGVSGAGAKLDEIAQLRAEEKKKLNKQKKMKNVMIQKAKQLNDSVK